MPHRQQTGRPVHDRNAGPGIAAGHIEELIAGHKRSAHRADRAADHGAADVTIGHLSAKRDTHAGSRSPKAMDELIESFRGAGRRNLRRSFVEKLSLPISPDFRPRQRRFPRGRQKDGCSVRLHPESGATAGWREARDFYQQGKDKRMSGIASAVSDSKEKWFEKFARFGLVSKGIVYFLMGTLSVLAAFGLSQKKGDKTEAFKVIHDQPFGKFILIAIAIGLLGYVMLRMFQAIKDTENKGRHLKGVLDRIGYGMSAVMYLTIGAYALKLALGGDDGGSGDSRQFIVSKVLEYPGGEYIIGVASIIVIGMGIHQIVRGIRGTFMKKVNLYRSSMKDTFKTAGRIGCISRGIVLGVVGYFLFHAAWLSSPGEARGTGAAFDFLQNRFGSLMMAIVALGLAGYGVFCFVKARYQKIDISL